MPAQLKHAWLDLITASVVGVCYAVLLAFVGPQRAQVAIALMAIGALAPLFYRRPAGSNAVVSDERDRMIGSIALSSLHAGDLLERSGVGPASTGRATRSVSFPVDAALAVGGEVAAGDRICLVGRNGSGKSTLLRIAAGLVQSDSGRRFAQPGATIRYLPQEPDFEGFPTTLAYVEAGVTTPVIALLPVGVDPATAAQSLAPTS